MRTKINWNGGWYFSKSDKVPENFSQLWIPVTLPHTWNAVDGQDGGNEAAVRAAVLHKTIPSHEPHLPGQLSAEEITGRNDR